MLKRISLQFGAKEGGEPLAFHPGPMTVFVGPNNSGKSLALLEVESYIESGGRAERRIIDRITPYFPLRDEAEKMLLARRLEGSPGPTIRDGWVRVSRMKPVGEHAKKRSTDVDEPADERLVSMESIVRALEAGDDRKPRELGLLYRDFLSLFTLRLDGRTRLALTQPRPAGDLQQHPANYLVSLFKDDPARAKIREITADAFGLYFVIDPTGITRFRIRMSKRPPDDAAEEQSLQERARAFHGEAVDIEELSDGVKAFTGLTAAVLSADYRIMLVDEPEAFLHPPLSRKLGRRLTQLASERGANVMVATHSPEFLMGCIQSGEQVNIVRLTYRHGVPGATFLPAEKLQLLMRDPLLRSTGVLSALFHEGAIVCEADADRVFYQEINERLLGSSRAGSDGSIFLNAQNKQTIRKILRPLREMGLPAAAVVDLDLFKSGDDLRDLLEAAFVPTTLRTAWEIDRRKFDQQIRNQDYKAGGIYTLTKQDRIAAQALLDNLADYGIFVVPTGELECWLTELEVGGHGPEWLTRTFDKMGTDPDDPLYLRPGSNGVWAFMERVAAWIGDPRRKGMSDVGIATDHLLPPAEVA